MYAADSALLGHPVDVDGGGPSRAVPRARPHPVRVESDIRAGETRACAYRRCRRATSGARTDKRAASRYLALKAEKTPVLPILFPPTHPLLLARSERSRCPDPPTPESPPVQQEGGPRLGAGPPSSTCQTNQGRQHERGSGAGVGGSRRSRHGKSETVVSEKWGTAVGTGAWVTTMKGVGIANGGSGPSVSDGRRAEATGASALRRVRTLARW